MLFLWGIYFVFQMYVQLAEDEPFVLTTLISVNLLGIFFRKEERDAAAAILFPAVFYSGRKHLYGGEPVLPIRRDTGKYDQLWDFAVV